MAAPFDWASVFNSQIAYNGVVYEGWEDYELEGFNIYYADSLDSGDKALQVLRRNADGIYGMDFMWQANNQHQISLIIVSSLRTVVLLQCKALQGLPDGLMKIWDDCSALIAVSNWGQGDNRVLRNLENTFNWSSQDFGATIVDVDVMAHDHGYGMGSPLAAQLLHSSYRDDLKLRNGNWEMQPLTRNHVRFAALEGMSHEHVFRQLLSQHGMGGVVYKAASNLAQHSDSEEEQPYIDAGIEETDKSSQMQSCSEQVLREVLNRTRELQDTSGYDDQASESQPELSSDGQCSSESSFPHVHPHQFCHYSMPVCHASTSGSGPSPLHMPSWSSPIHPGYQQVPMQSWQQVPQVQHVPGGVQVMQGWQQVPQVQQMQVTPIMQQYWGGPQLQGPHGFYSVPQYTVPQYMQTVQAVPQYVQVSTVPVMQSPMYMQTPLNSAPQIVYTQAPVTTTPMYSYTMPPAAKASPAMSCKTAGKKHGFMRNSRTTASTVNVASGQQTAAPPSRQSSTPVPSTPSRSPTSSVIVSSTGETLTRVLDSSLAAGPFSVKIKS